MIRVLEDIMIRLVVPGLLGFASFVAALVAVSQFIAALPSNPAALSVTQWDAARLATAGISAGFAVMFVGMWAILVDLARRDDSPIPPIPDDEYRM
jgi:hypothetical protein